MNSYCKWRKYIVSTHVRPLFASRFFPFRSYTRMQCNNNDPIASLNAVVIPLLMIVWHKRIALEIKSNKLSIRNEARSARLNGEMSLLAAREGSNQIHRRVALLFFSFSQSVTVTRRFNYETGCGNPYIKKWDCDRETCVYTRHFNNKLWNMA